MKKVKVYYAKINNMGDLLNELIIENVMGYKVIHSGRFTCQTSGIGSSLNHLFPAKSKLPSLSKQLIQKIYTQIQPPIQIWSTGFINYSDEEHVCIRKVNNISSVRGELSRKRLEKILKTNLNVPTGDGGLLASHLLKSPIKKLYSVGIIPHYKEMEEVKFKELKGNYKNSILIDLRNDPLKVVEAISQCELVLSSSLHGLIVADSFGIPNARLVYTDRLKGDGFKFDDYYSSFNVPSEFYDLKTHGNLTVNAIIDNYKITNEMVECKKKEIFERFMKYI